MKNAGLALLLTVAACGYSTRTLYDPDIKTVAVDVFKNDTFRRGLELDLTRKVAEQVRLRTPWRVANRSGADVALTGRIVDVREIVLSETVRDLTQESSVVVRVEAVLTDIGTGKVIKKVARTSSEAFLIPVGETMAGALDRALAEVAEDIVQALEDWN